MQEDEQRKHKAAARAESHKHKRNDESEDEPELEASDNEMYDADVSGMSGTTGGTQEENEDGNEVPAVSNGFVCSQQPEVQVSQLEHG